MSMNKKIFEGSTILCDIDSTITDLVPEHPCKDLRNGLFQIIAGHLARRMNIAEDASGELLNNFADNINIWWDYPDFITQFALDPAAFWGDLKDFHKEALFVYDDAVEMIKELHKMGKTIHIVSNNPVTGCLMKLERAGLATLCGTPYFSRIFATNVTKGMKSQVRLWQSVLNGLNESPGNVLTIGDSVKEDFEAPSKTGVLNTIIVDRKQKQDVIESSRGFISVKSLTLVKELIR